MSETFIIVLTAINASLYTVVGFMTYLGIVMFGVRFWPAVVVPAVFSVLFGPVVGGVGAAIGIFICDMLSHGMPILSLSVGVTSNFIAFYILGRMTREYSLNADSCRLEHLPMDLHIRDTLPADTCSTNS